MSGKRAKSAVKPKAAPAERLDGFMARANAAYYGNRDPFADFTTSPEITQVFGEVLGIWAAVVWRALGSPAPVILAEAGPGRGTLMSDALRAVAQVMPPLTAAAQVHLLETSPRLRAVQAEKLPDATWHDSFTGLPPGPLLLIANEFLDALPIRQFVRHGDGWAERFVLDGAFVERPTADAPGVAAAEGQIAEIGPAALAFVTEVARRVAASGGAALFLDYGPEASAAGESLQSIRDGKAAHPLADPGQADLTAHVDFQALAEAARAAGASVYGPVPQGMFLTRLGLFQRTGSLVRLNPEQAAALHSGAQRLAEPDQMGRLFKVLAICHPALPTPPGFTG
jgi:NADH dehydrogenase [ubiquinone] 1 alpha subcomplex assembly factor 7